MAISFAWIKCTVQTGLTCSKSCQTTCCSSIYLQEVFLCHEVKSNPKCQVEFNTVSKFTKKLGKLEASCQYE